MAPPCLQGTRMSIDAFMYLTKKERSGMMQTKIRQKTIATQHEGFTFCGCARPVPGSSILKFSANQRPVCKVEKRTSVGGANEGGCVEVTRAGQWRTGEREVSKRYSRGRRSHPNM